MLRLAAKVVYDTAVHRCSSETSQVNLLIRAHCPAGAAAQARRPEPISSVEGSDLCVRTRFQNPRIDVEFDFYFWLGEAFDNQAGADGGNILQVPVDRVVDRRAPSRGRQIGRDPTDMLEAGAGFLQERRHICMAWLAYSASSSVWSF